jgi:hypothetical protein
MHKLFTVSLLIWVVACQDPPPAFNAPVQRGPSIARPPNLNNLNTDDRRCASDQDCAQGLRCCDQSCTRADACDALAPCQRHGDPCPLDPSLGVEPQGDFYCARLASLDGPTCLAACEIDFSADTCPTGAFCLTIGANDQQLTLCLPAECQGHGDCATTSPQGGTCVPFGNGAGFCYPAGDAPRGDFCTSERLCAPGLFCLGGTLDASCQPLCELWNPQGDPCGPDRACGYLTNGTGICRPRTTQGRGPNERCDPQGDWCADGLQCFDFQPAGDPLPLCTAWCRPGSDDCRGRFQDQQGFCRAVFSGPDGQPVPDIGLCL